MQSGPVYGHVGNRSPENAAKSRAGLESSHVPLQSSDCFRRTQRRRGSPQPSPRPRHDPAQMPHPRPLTGAEPVVPGIPEVFWRDAETGERNLEGVISVASDGNPIQRNDELNAWDRLSLQTIVVSHEE